jgi:hypothetical protein
LQSQPSATDYPTKYLTQTKLNYYREAIDRLGSVDLQLIEATTGRSLQQYKDVVFKSQTEKEWAQQKDEVISLLERLDSLMEGELHPDYLGLKRSIDFNFIFEGEHQKNDGQKYF